MELQTGHIQILLENRNGDFVSYAQVPAFNPPVEIVTWGQRMFARVEKVTYQGGQSFDHYREGTVWVVRDPTPYDQPLPSGADQEGL